ncbi:hypothetical protein [Nocardioides sp.]|uniref:hypothetical protein n=1 Tax=Nocardioides sp. TaxID=35761 RepID=UPI00271B2897|nr:hypothetical protein [Nocardioides sp.]MDO9455247.1 hypothetical protein [Nocardioides sp.]
MLRAPVPEQVVWASVTRPPVPLVYLDLNHYIGLAKASRAAAGHTADDGRPITVLPGYAELLDAARRAKYERRAVFTLSNVHFMEVAHAVPSPRQRGHIADIMEDLTDFTYLLGRTFIAQLEIAAGLDHIYGSAASYAPMPLLGRSALWAFNRNGHFRFINEESGEDSGPAMRAELGDDEFDRRLAEMNRYMERRLLEGPRDAEIPQLRANGYDPETYEIGATKRLDFELETSATLQRETHWRRGRLRDLVFGRDVGQHWTVPVVEHLEQRGQDGFRNDMPAGPDMIALWAAMPQVQVAVSMKTRYHRNPAHRWKINHIADIDALAVAYPYCDIVLTDAEARGALVNARELTGFGARLPRTVAEAADLLNGLPAVDDFERQIFHPPQSRV